jgi:hypothetical protein
MRLYMKKQPSGCFFIGVSRSDLSCEFQPMFANQVAPMNALFGVQPRNISASLRSVIPAMQGHTKRNLDRIPLDIPFTE